jgi:hypothetical protein
MKLEGKFPGGIVWYLMYDWSAGSIAVSVKLQTILDVEVRTDLDNVERRVGTAFTEDINSL